MTKRSIRSKVFLPLLAAAALVLEKEDKIRPSVPYYLELTLVGNRRMAGLNHRFHGKSGPTDVISLSYSDSLEIGGFAGEIFISLPFAAAQAAKIGQPFMEELRFLFIHGLLHIFGYDHKKPRDEAVMNKIANFILRRI